MDIIAIGSPKGGVAKTTTTVTVAAVLADSGARVLVVDGDVNQSAADWIGQEDGAIPVDVADGRDVRELRRLRGTRGYDVALLDLPGARAGAFGAILRGEGRPVADLLVAPCGPELVEMRPTLRTVHSEVMPLGLRTLVVFTRVLTLSLPRAIERRDQLRADGIPMADTVVRRYSAYDEAAEMGVTVLSLPGSHSYARQAEADYRALTMEIEKELGR